MKISIRCCNYRYLLINLCFMFNLIQKYMRRILLMAFMATTFALSAQIRYLDEVFTPAEIEIVSDVTYGTNVNYFISDFSDPTCVAQDLGQLWPLVLTQQPIPTAFYNPADTTTCVKVSH